MLTNLAGGEILRLFSSRISAWCAFSRHSVLLAAIFLFSPAWGIGLLEKEIIFSESDIQAALAKSGPIQKNYGGLITVSLREAPTIRLDTPDGRVGIAGSMDIQLLGSAPISVDLTGRAGIRYDDRNKAFYLENPVVDAVQSPALRKDAEPTARQAATQLISSYFRAKPVYVLRDDGSLAEATARWLLKSVRVESGSVVAVLSPL